MVRLVLIAISLAACIENPPRAISLDRKYFECQVQPVLDKSCSQNACHGDARRPFHVFARNRMRVVGTNVQRDLPLSTEELDANFTNALGFASPDDPPKSWLLMKPLDERAGGYFHRGQDLFGGDDVFVSTDDPDYERLLGWISGAAEQPDCVYAGTQAVTP
jgi:hypothetical protein